MPLPAALASRLAKRGLVKKEEAKKSEERKQVEGVEEEVFAEDYDEPDIPGIPTPALPDPSAVPQPDSSPRELEEERLVHEVPGCPNRWNRCHECSDYCRDRWGFKEFEPDTDLDRKRVCMLKKFPLPDDWEEVGDPETGRYYYWNMNTDEVSWLPPIHPRAQISLPADRLKELFDKAKAAEDSDSSSLSDEDDDDGDIMDIDDFEEIERKILMEKSAKEKEKSRKDNNKKRREEALDPMDPAAYSDISRGNWSSGLDKRGSAKTGVDATASGPLFQMRPYPSPGAILRMNKDLTDDK